MKTSLAIIGGGPAGLRAASVAVGKGISVTLFDSKPSVGRKFLVAGKGGLNLTKAEPAGDFARNYTGPEMPSDIWAGILADFDHGALRDWTNRLGVDTFTASTGRVYPHAMKAAPLLRRWVQQLRHDGVQFRQNHRWTGLRRNDSWELDFTTSDGMITVSATAVVFALGGGSWPGTGSDGCWVEEFSRQGITVNPLTPANCGWEVSWPPGMAETEGQPLKNVEVSTGSTRVMGELLLTRYGLEGGALYQLGPALRHQQEPTISIDLKPGVSAERLVRRLGVIRQNFLPEARVRWKLSDAAFSLLCHVARGGEVLNAESLAQRAKAVCIRLRSARPLAEAISSAGGVAWSELDSDLMLKSHPGLFFAGEMIDWEAPTGGYLLHGCLATGTRAGAAAAAWQHPEN